MKTPGKPPESRGKGAGKEKRSAPVTEAFDGAAATPMDKFKQLARSVVAVPRQAVLKAEREEKRRKKRD